MLSRPARQSKTRVTRRGVIAKKAIPYRLHHHELYGTWIMARNRCNNPRSPDYPRYGGRGIKVSDFWPNGRAFIDWVEENLGPRPEGHSLDRIDNDGDYEPDNLRWADNRQQGSNRNFCILVDLDGETMSLNAALLRLGVAQ